MSKNQFELAIMPGSIALLSDKKAEELNISKASCYETAKAYYEEREIRPLIPWDTWESFEILPVTFNLAVVNKFNLNGDGIDTDTAMSLAREFKNRPLNIEHKKDLIVGHIINSSLGDREPEYYEGDFSKFYGRTNTFYITAAGVIYKHLYPKLAEAILEAANPASEKYKSISTSWEISFSEYKIMKGDNPYLADCSEVEDQEAAKPLLRQRKGKGVDAEGKNLYRLIKGDVRALGVALTMDPAADVRGVFTQYPFFDKEDDTVKVDEDDMEDGSDDNDEDDASKKVQKTSAASSLSPEQSATLVKLLETSNMDKTQFDSLVKTIEESIASKAGDPIHAQLTDALRKFSENYVNSAKEKEQAEALAKKEFEDLKTKTEKLEQALAEAKASLDARAAAELLETRMAKITDKYELSEAELDIVGGDVAKIVSDEDFASYEKRTAIIFASKLKGLKKETETSNASVVKTEKVEKDEPAIEGKPEESIANTNEGTSGGSPSAVSELVKQVKVKFSVK